MTTREMYFEMRLWERTHNTDTQEIIWEQQGGYRKYVYNGIWIEYVKLKNSVDSVILSDVPLIESLFQRSQFF